jgi:anti-sigma B factor antagonist
VANSKVKMVARQARGNVAVIDIAGEVSSFAEDELMAAYGEAVSEGAHAVILNFSDVEYINSSGIGLLVTLLIRASRQDVSLLAFGLSAHYRRIFELTRLNEAIRVYDDEEDALEAANA